MKRFLVFLVLFILAAQFSLAGSITYYGYEYEYDEIVADKLGDLTDDDIQDMIDSGDLKLKNKIKKVDKASKQRDEELAEKDSEIEAFIEANNAKWSHDTGGTSLSRVMEYLEEDFIPALKEFFMPRSELKKEIQDLHERIDLIESRFYNVSLEEYQKAYAYTKSLSINSSYTHGLWTCSIDGFCIKNN